VAGPLSASCTIPLAKPELGLASLSDRGTIAEITATLLSLVFATSVVALTCGSGLLLGRDSFLFSAEGGALG
jgi:hypothetical protein